MAGERRASTAVQPILSRAAGVLRDRERLGSAIGLLAALARFASAAADPALVALMITVAALRREHSLGACRTDFPRRPAAPAGSRLDLVEAFADAEAVAPRSLARQLDVMALVPLPPRSFAKRCLRTSAARAT